MTVPPRLAREPLDGSRLRQTTPGSDVRVHETCCTRRQARGRESSRASTAFHVLVVGDVMLDRFIVGRVSRIFARSSRTGRPFRVGVSALGGAANVAHNLVTLGGHVSLVGVIGTDPASARLAISWRPPASSAEGLRRGSQSADDGKVRIVTERNQQVARIDYEHDSDVKRDLGRVSCGHASGAWAPIRRCCWCRTT